MKAIIFILLKLIIFLYCIVLSDMYAQIVSLSGKTFRLNGSNYYPIVANFRTDFIYNTSTAEYFTSPAGKFPGMNNQTAANAQYQKNFQKLKAIGFNSVRITLCANYAYDEITHSRKFIVKFANYDPSHWQTTEDKLNLNIPDFDNANSDLFFDNLENILDQADIAGIKVILLCMGRTKGNDTIPTPIPSMYPTRDAQAVNDCKVYLEHLAARLDGHPALMAYDLYNEPLYQGLTVGMNNAHDDKSSFNWKKEDICGFVKEWYDAIRQNDSQHLITLGGSSIDEVFLFDMGILKLDFYSLHIYPVDAIIDANSTINTIERFKSIIYWMYKVCPIPWMIGETGFSANDQKVVPKRKRPYMDGTEAEQTYFVAQSLQAVRDANASGYSWWEFQSFNMYDSTNDDYNLNHFGLIQPDLIPWSPSDPLLEKTAAAALTSYTHPDPVTPTQPANYYDPFDIASVYNTTKHNAVYGYVKDLDGNPIEGAVVRGTSWIDDKIHPKKGLIRILEFPYTFTDHTGYFEIVPYNYEYPGDLNAYFISALDITAVGASSAHLGAGWGGEKSQMTHNAGNVYLKRTSHNYDHTISNQIYSLSGTPSHHSHNSLILYDDILQGIGILGASGIFTAGQSVAVLPDFEAEAGSELSLYTLPVYASCAQLNGYRLMSDGDKTGVDTEPQILGNIESIQIQFSPNAKMKSIVFPNPVHEQITIELKDALHYPYNVKIYTLNGILAREILMDRSEIQTNLGGLPKGMYILKIENENEQNIHKFSLY